MDLPGLEQLAFRHSFVAKYACCGGLCASAVVYDGPLMGHSIEYSGIFVDGLKLPALAGLVGLGLAGCRLAKQTTAAAFSATLAGMQHLVALDMRGSSIYAPLSLSSCLQRLDLGGIGLKRLPCMSGLRRWVWGELGSVV